MQGWPHPWRRRRRGVTADAAELGLHGAPAGRRGRVTGGSNGSNETGNPNVADGVSNGLVHCSKRRARVAMIHSITSSARASNFGGTSRPSALAVLRLMTNSNLVGCCTGRSPGLAPLKILST